MPTTNQIRRHADLVDRMANAQGIDLEEQMLRGTLSISDLDDAVLRCTGCTAPDRCEAWLKAQTGTAEATPAYCRNAEEFDALRGK